ncbi:MAG: ABC transporter substrate-binding protein [Alphaproteobacteria bacterium]
MNKGLVGLGLAAALLAAPAAAETVKIGFLGTFSGPAAIIGKHMKDALELGLDHVDHKLGGMDVEMLYGDDQRKPDVGKQTIDKWLKRDKVNFVTGIIWSNVMMAIHGPVTRSNAFLISTNAGPSPIAGGRCSENYFTTSWQNDNSPEAMGQYMTDQGVDNVYVMSPNYQAGKDMVSGFKRYFKGKVVAEVYTKLGQADYAAELTQLRAAKPDAVFVFLPGGMGIQFVKQYAQAGLKEQFPLYSVFTVDNLTLKPQGEAAIGVLSTAFWDEDLDNPENKRFVAAFKAKYGYTPSTFSAQTYDLPFFLDAAIREAGGLSDKDKLRAALKNASFKSVRGKFAFNSNHFPIQNFYLRKVVKGPDGQPRMALQATIFEDHKDNYGQDCKLK